MQTGFTIITTAGKRDRDVRDDAPVQQTMRAAVKGLPHNPTAEDKRVRRQMARQAYSDRSLCSKCGTTIYKTGPYWEDTGYLTGCPEGGTHTPGGVESTAAADTGGYQAPSKWREHLDRKQYAEQYDPRRDSDGDPPDPPDPSGQHESAIVRSARRFIAKTMHTDSQFGH